MVVAEELSLLVSDSSTHSSLQAAHAVRLFQVLPVAESSLSGYLHDKSRLLFRFPDTVTPSHGTLKLQ